MKFKRKPSVNAPFSSKKSKSPSALEEESSSYLVRIKSANSSKRNLHMGPSQNIVNDYDDDLNQIDE